MAAAVDTVAGTADMVIAGMAVAAGTVTAADMAVVADMVTAADTATVVDMAVAADMVTARRSDFLCQINYCCPSISPSDISLISISTHLGHNHATVHTLSHLYTILHIVGVNCSNFYTQIDKGHQFGA